MKRKKPLKKYNTRKRKKSYEKKFGVKAEWVREQECCVCFAPAPSHPHHVVSRNRGGDKESLIPLCFRHHTGSEGVHTLGPDRFQNSFQIGLSDMAILFEGEWCRREIAGAKNET